MLKQNKRVCVIRFLTIAFFIIFGVCFFTLQAQAGDPNEEGDTYIDINQNTVWRSVDDLNLKKTVSVNLGATLTIEKGAKIKFGKDVNGGDTYLSVNGGRLIANGTQEEPISITADADQQYYLLEFRRNYWEDVPESLPSFLRYVKIYGGGYAWDTDCPECASFFRNLIPMAHASIEGSPAMSFTGGKVHLENCTFHDNKYADIEIQYNEFDSNTDVDNYLEIVNSNFEKNGNSMAVKSELWCKDGSLGCASKILLKNNWYGSQQGPRQAIASENSDGKEISGNILVDGWRVNGMIADPLVVIPGIMGSAEVSGILKIDPILHTYDDLIESLETNGYEKNKNLFEFPYEWRNNNANSAQKLQTKINEITNDTKISKADLVAHSMGGLVARSYIESGTYGNNVDDLITLGTPHHGSPEAYLKWEAGEGFFSWKDRFTKHHFEMEALHNHYSNIFSYIQERIPSVKELLPDYDYLFDVSQNSMRSYPNNYPENTFLEELNYLSNLDKLKNVDFTNIIGVLDNNQSTISEIQVADSDIDERWENGMPENFYDGNTDQGLEYNKGDGTVPEKSAENIPADKTLKTNATHNDLPTVSQCAVLYELTGKNDCIEVAKIHIPNLLMFNIFSPIDIQVIDPNNKRVGKDFATGEIINEIEGAYYTGSGTENEFLTIPNPVDGEYKILTEGMGSGEYKIEVAKITEDPTTGVASESVVEITGTTIPDQEETKEIKVAGNEVSAESQDTVAPEISIKSPEENKTYLNNQNLKINYTVSDNVSRNIQTEVALDGNIFIKENIDLSLQNLGEHKFKITATDEAGNLGEKEISFQIETDIKVIIDNINHYSTLNLIKNKADKTVLISRLKLIQEIEGLKKIIENSRFFNNRTKEKLIKALEGQVNEQLDWLMKYVAQRSKVGVKNGIDPKIGGLLIESILSQKL